MYSNESAFSSWSNEVSALQNNIFLLSTILATLDKWQMDTSAVQFFHPFCYQKQAANAWEIKWKLIGAYSTADCSRKRRFGWCGKYAGSFAIQHGNMQWHSSSCSMMRLFSILFGRDFVSKRVSVRQSKTSTKALITVSLILSFSCDFPSTLHSFMRESLFQQTWTVSEKFQLLWLDLEKDPFCLVEAVRAINELWNIARSLMAWNHVTA